MKDKFAIFLDIDGTIYDGKEVKKEDLDAIKKARKEGKQMDKIKKEKELKK